MHVPWWWPFGRVDEIAPKDLEKQLSECNDCVQLVDVREHFEYAQGHIAGATSMPVHDLPRALGSLGLDPQRPVVAICLSGHRSVPAFRLLRRRGYNQVYSLAGGMLAWWSAQLPVSRDSKP